MIYAVAGGLRQECDRGATGVRQIVSWFCLSHLSQVCRTLVSGGCDRLQPSMYKGLRCLCLICRRD